METYKQIFEESNRTILDCFTGADGGVEYIKYLSIMRDFADQADRLGETAIELVIIVEKMAKLIKVLNKQG